MRVTRRSQTTGSEHWLRVAIEEYPQMLNDSVRRTFLWENSEEIDWCSPVREDEFAEYRDQSFLDRLQVGHLSVSLSSFWPPKGPQWDGLGRTPTGRLILVEAKAYRDEVQDGGTAASSTLSKELIHQSLLQTRDGLGASREVDWSKRYYQYVNRLAHLYFLRELNGFDAYLLFLNFAEPPDRDGAASETEWKRHTAAVRAALGLGSVDLRGVADLVWSVPRMLAGKPADFVLEGET